MSVLSIQDIHKQFDGKSVLNGVSASLAEHEMVCLLGVSGSGKTTLFNIVSGLELPDSGEVLLRGESIVGKPGNVSYMLQKDLLLPYRKVIDNVTLPLTLQGIPRRQAREQAEPLFAAFGLEGTQYQYPDELSGGMRQRAAFLRTYLSSRGVALLDEPFSALDAITKSRLHRWYLELLPTLNLSTLFITHDIDEAILLSDRVYVLGEDGRMAGEFRIDRPCGKTEDFALTVEFLEYKKDILRCLRKNSAESVTG